MFGVLYGKKYCKLNIEYHVILKQKSRLNKMSYLSFTSMSYLFTDYLGLFGI